VGGANLNTILWYFGDGSETRVENPIHKYTAPGSYTVSLVAYNIVGGIVYKDSISQIITINTAPPITFSYLGGGTNITSDTTFTQGGNLTITISENYPIYLWAPDGETTNSITVNKTGTYTAMVIDANGCSSKKIQNIKVLPLTEGDSANIIISNNVLTPNNDGVNDYFSIEDFETYSSPIDLSIYNIWGDIVYQTADYQNDWDGTYNGKPLDSGTYYYVISSENRKGTMGYIDILK
jgi:gliding motility-associated-like protein